MGLGSTNNTTYRLPRTLFRYQYPTRCTPVPCPSFYHLFQQEMLVSQQQQHGAVAITTVCLYALSEHLVSVIVIVIAISGCPHPNMLPIPVVSHGGRSLPALVRADFSGSTGYQLSRLKHEYYWSCECKCTPQRLFSYLEDY